MIVQACYSIFNEDRLLDLSLMSIADFVDKIVIVDGPYIGFDHKALKSNPKTYKILKKFGKVVTKVITIDRPMSEEKKRSLYFTGDCDLYFLLDGDEVVIGNIDKGLDWVRNQPHRDVFGVRVVLPRSLHSAYPRILRCKEGLYYDRCDDMTIRDGDGKVYSPVLNFPVVPDFAIINLEFLRSVRRQEVWARYNRIRTGLEKG